MIPKKVWPSVALPDDAIGWRAVVTSVQMSKGIKITCIGEEGTRNSNVPFGKQRCVSQGVVALSP